MKPDALHGRLNAAAVAAAAAAAPPCCAAHSGTAEAVEAGIEATAAPGSTFGDGLVVGECPDVEGGVD